MPIDAVHFLTLPTELRLQIYDYLFIGQTLRANAFHYPLDDDKGTQGHVSLQPQSPLLNILLTNKQIHQEALPRFYTLIRFHFERHSVDEITWSLSSVLATFPDLTLPCRLPQSATTNNNPLISETKTLVQYISYAGNDPHFIRHASVHFPNLKILEFDLSWDHIGIDQTNFDRAMKQAIRNREWRHAVKDALEQRFPEGMVGAVFEVQKVGFVGRGKGMGRGIEGSESGGGCGRTFRVLLRWRLAYRFVEFVGECDLDEWILRVRDPDGRSKNVYEIRQDPMFYEMS